MFTGIIEQTGIVDQIVEEGSNIHFRISSPLAKELKIDQSLSHDGVCLTVVQVNAEDDQYTVTAIQETLMLTSLRNWKVGSSINLERAMLMSGRLDGHIVQGHVDGVAHVEAIESVEGSWYFSFRIAQAQTQLMIAKGSICINGVSLTLIEPKADTFKVAIIPYTYEHTNFNSLEIASVVNIEYDVLGKYVAKHLSNMQ